MVKHIVIWDFKDGLSPAEKQAHGQTMKAELENLKNLIDGIVELRVVTNPLDTSNAEIMLYSAFTDEAALRSYIDHPEHKRVGTFVRSVTQGRKAIDFEV